MHLPLRCATSFWGLIIKISSGIEQAVAVCSHVTVTDADRRRGPKDELSTMSNKYSLVFSHRTIAILSLASGGKKTVEFGGRAGK